MQLICHGKCVKKNACYEANNKIHTCIEGRKMKLSVVVPIYNVEKYLTECLESVIRQKIVYEIVLVNDGSTDRSLDIIVKYKKLDKRIKVIDKSNSGYGDSVNKGIAFASGDYVGILESDDIVIDGAYAELMNIAELTNVDIVKGNYNSFKTPCNNIAYQSNMGSFEYNKVIFFKDNPSILFVAPSIWSAIYKKSFLIDNRIELLPTPGASYQDLSFAFKTWISSKSIRNLMVSTLPPKSSSTTRNTSLMARPKASLPTIAPSLEALEPYTPHSAPRIESTPKSLWITVRKWKSTPPTGQA